MNRALGQLSRYEVEAQCGAKKRTLRASFTLVEMLVAIAVLSILSLLLMTMLNAVSGSWGQVQAQIDTRQTGRSILTLISSDLRPAALPKDRSNTNSLQFVVNPPVLATATSSVAGSPTTGGYLYPHAFFWQAPIGTDTTFGNMAEVGYFIRWDLSTPTNPRARLCRFFCNEATSRTSLVGLTSQEQLDQTYYQIYKTPTAWITTSILDGEAPGNLANNYQGWVADNVIALWIRCLDSTGTPITQNSGMATANVSVTMNYAYDSRQGYKTAASIIKSGSYDATSRTSQFLCTLPPYVEIAVVVLDAQTAARLTTIPTYTPTTPNKFWSDINTFVSNLPANIRKGARVYSTRVRLINGG